MANPAAEARTRVLAEHPEAVVVKRGRNNLKHRLADAPDGRQRFALDCSIGPLHYGPGQDQEIDTAFLPSVAPWDWEMTKAGFEVRALSRLDAGQVIEYRSGSEYVRFQPMALQYSNDLDQIQPISMPANLDAAVDDDTLTWADGYGPGIGISWQAQTARLAKRLTIDNPAALPPVEQYILDGGNPVLELNFIFAHSKGVTPWINGEPWDKKQRETQGLVEFRDGDGNILWWFNLPLSWDANREGQLGTFRFRKTGNSLYVSHRVPLSFVQAACYPLVLDVDVDDTVDANTDDMWESEDDGNVTDSATAQQGRDDDVTPSSRNWPGWRWHSPTGSWPANGDTIDVAYMEAYFYSAATDDPHCHIYAEDAAGPATFTAGAGNYNISGRTATTAKVEYQAIAVGIGYIQSPSLVSVIQELVTDYTITAVVLIWKPGTIGGTHLDYSYHTSPFNYSAAEAAKLHIEYTAAGGQTFYQSVAGSLVTAGALSRKTSIFPSGVLSSSGAIGTVATWCRSLAGTLASSGALGWLWPKALAGTLSSAGSLTAKGGKTLAGELASAGSLTRKTTASFVGAFASVGAVAPKKLVAVAYKSLAGTLVATGTLARKTATSLAGELTFGGAGTVEPLIEAGVDDGYLHPGTEGWGNADWNVELGSDRYGWWHWPSAAIPRGAAIQVAKVQFRAYHSDPEACDLRIEGCDEDDSDALTSWADYVSRPKTSLVNWNGVESWTAGQLYWSASIKTIIEAITSRPGWNSGQAIQLIVKGLVPIAEAHRAPGMYDAGATYAAKLYVEYLVPGGGLLSTVATWSRSLAGTLASTGALGKKGFVVAAGVLSSVGTVVPKAGKALSGVLSSSGAMSTTLWKYTTPILVQGTLALAGTGIGVKLALKGVGGTLASTGALASQFVLGKAVGGTLSLAGTLKGTASKALAGSLNLTGGLARKSWRAFAGTLGLVGSLIARLWGPGKVIEVTGSVDTTIDAVGSVDTLLGVKGSDDTTIDVKGSV